MFVNHTTALYRTIVKKIGIVVFVIVILLLNSCSLIGKHVSNDSNDSNSGIYISSIISSIGAVGNNNTNDHNTQSFKYTVTMTNGGTTDAKIVSVELVLSESFSERVQNKETIIYINGTVSRGGHTSFSGEFIFDAAGLTKEQIENLKPFIKEVKVLEERIINKSF